MVTTFLCFSFAVAYTSRKKRARTSGSFSAISTLIATLRRVTGSYARNTRPKVYRTDEYEDFNMNHKADWFKSIREGHLRPAVDIEIAHRTATLCNLANLSMILGRKLVWDGNKQTVVGDAQANRMLSKPQRYPYCL